MVKDTGAFEKWQKKIQAFNRPLKISRMRDRGVGRQRVEN